MTRHPTAYDRVATGDQDTPLVPPVAGSQLSLSVLRIESDPRLVGDDSADTLLFVYAGSGSVELDGNSTSLASGSAVFVPAGGGAMVRTDGSPLVTLHALVGPEGDIHAPLGATAHTAAVDRSASHSATGSRSFQVLFGPENGCTRATLFVGYVPPGRAPWHFHQYDEIVWIWNGTARYHLGQGVSELRSGDAVRVHPREVHVIENLGGGDLALLGLFTPAGSPSAAYLAPVPVPVPS